MVQYDILTMPLAAVHHTMACWHVSRNPGHLITINTSIFYFRDTLPQMSTRRWSRCSDVSAGESSKKFEIEIANFGKFVMNKSFFLIIIRHLCAERDDLST
jgi:hypothetical protein